MTLKEHKEFGTICKKLRDNLIKKQRKILNNCPNKMKGKLKTRNYTRSIKAFEDLKHHLEEIIFLELREEIKNINNQEILEIYYGNSNN